MRDLKAAARQLFDSYLAAWNARDFAGIAACFGEPALFVLPQGSVLLPTRDAVSEMMTGLFQRLEAGGFSHSVVGDVEVRQCGECVAVLDASDVRRISRDGSVMEAIDSHYVIERQSGRCQFIVVMACNRGWRAAP